VIPEIAALPRANLGLYPTPLVAAPKLSAFLGGLPIYFKRDDLTGLALGGNKCRKLEFLLAEVIHQGYNAVVSGASSQSNWCLQLAAAARRLGIVTSFVVRTGVHAEIQGNLLLHRILGSDVEILSITDRDVAKNPRLSEDVMQRFQSAAVTLQARGLRPFVMDMGLSNIYSSVGPVGWVNAADELAGQLRSQGISSAYVVLAGGGGGTAGGLIAGLKHLGTDYEVVTFSIARKKEMLAPSIATQANAALGLLNLPTKVAAEELRIEDSFIGPGYGIPTNECLDAIRIVARTEAIFLDPVYTGKAMAGLIEWVKTGRFDSKRPIVFVHTGGIPALFAYYEELTA